MSTHRQFVNITTVDVQLMRHGHVRCEQHISNAARLEMPDSRSKTLTGSSLPFLSGGCVAEGVERARRYGSRG